MRRLKESGDQFTTVVTQIAKDMNEVGVSEVLNNLEKYKTVNKTPSEKPGTLGAVNQSSPDKVPVQTGPGPRPDPREAVNQPVPKDLMEKLKAKLKNSDWARNNSYTDEKTRKIIIEFEDDGKVYLISNDEETSRPIILSVKPVSEQQ
jgi:hypothetical protein